MATKKKGCAPLALDRVMGAEACEVQRMTSLEIAEICGKPHNDLMKAIRKMEHAWMKVHGGNFSLKQRLVQTSNGASRMVPYYDLTKLECLYIATKFNDEARAKLVIRWAELEDWYQESLRRELERMRSKTRQLVQHQEELKGELTELEPLADYCKETLQSVSSFTVRSIAHSLKMTPQELNKILCAAHIQFGRSGRYTPYVEYARRGFTKTRTYNHRNKDGTVTTERFTTWTELGIRFINDLVAEVRRRQRPPMVMVQLSLQF